MKSIIKPVGIATLILLGGIIGGALWPTVHDWANNLRTPSAEMRYNKILEKRYGPNWRKVVERRDRESEERQRQYESDERTRRIIECELQGYSC